MKRTKYPIHPDFKRWAHMNPPLTRAAVPVIQRALGLLFDREKSSPDMKVERKAIPAGGGAELRALLYAPAGAEAAAPCLLYCHGGGFVLPAAPYHYGLAREYARRARCRVLFVDYRLAPAHPFPTAPEDCFAAYAWVLQNAGALAVDPARVAVAGDSAGGELAAAVCLMAGERDLPMPCAQMLVYPVTGAGDTPSMRTYTDTPMCSSRDMAKYTSMYRPVPGAADDIRGAPVRAASLAGLPTAYVETAEFDCLRDDGILYARRLEEAGVPVELNKTEGTIHGFDIEGKSPIVRACVDRRAAFLERSFSR